MKTTTIRNLFLLQALLLVVFISCQKDNGEYATIENPSASQQKANVLNNYNIEDPIEVQNSNSKTKVRKNYNNKAPDPECTHKYDLVEKDLNCPQTAENCCDPVVIEPSSLTAFRNAVEGDKNDIYDFFNTTSNWEDIFPFLSNSEWETNLDKLQSGDYDMEEVYDAGLDIYGYIAQNSSGDYFVMRIIEE